MCTTKAIPKVTPKASPKASPKSSPKSSQGLALISALAFLMVTLSLVTMALLVSSSSAQLAANDFRANKAQAAAEAGVDRILFETVHYVMGQHFQENVAAGATQTGNPAENCDDDDAAPRLVSMLDAIRVRLAALEPGISEALADGSRYHVEARLDESRAGNVLFITSTGFYGEGERASRRRIRQEIALISGEQSSAFAVMTNNVNCIFCHTTITSIEAAYDDQGNLLGKANLDVAGRPRVRVAVLESLNMTKRPQGAGRMEHSSIITGTLYTREHFATSRAHNNDSYGLAMVAMDEAGRLAALPASFPSHVHSNSRAHERAIHNCAQGECPPRENFYLNYPRSSSCDGSDLPDGPVPESFALPVADLDNNRIIDNSEWAAAIRNDSLGRGYLETNNPQALRIMPTHASPGRGRLGAPENYLLQGRARLDTANDGRGIPGNLILQGSLSSPVHIHNSVYVDGDVVISGYTSGQGRLIVRGNIYIVGDVMYACGNVRCNYSLLKHNPPADFPRFAMTAVGNILMGDYALSATQSDPQGERFHGGRYRSPDNRFRYASSLSAGYLEPGRYLDFWTMVAYPERFGGSRNEPTAARDNRDIGEDLLWNFRNAWVDGDNFDGRRRSGSSLAAAERQALGITAGNSDRHHVFRSRASFSMNELAGFNQGEYERALADASYTPRFYRFRNAEGAFQEEFAGVYRCADASQVYNCRSFGDPYLRNRQGYQVLNWTGNFVRMDDCHRADIAFFASQVGMSVDALFANDSPFAFGTAYAFDGNLQSTGLINNGNDNIATIKLNRRRFDNSIDDLRAYVAEGRGSHGLSGEDVSRIWRAACGDEQAIRALASAVGQDYSSFAAGINALPRDPIYQRAVIVDLSPAHNWLARARPTLSPLSPIDPDDYRYSELALRQLYINNIESGRLAGALHLDGILYSANGIFTITGTNSNLQGSVIINGSLIAADLGMLAAPRMQHDTSNMQADRSGLRVHYDERLAPLLGVQTSGVDIFRSNVSQVAIEGE